MTKVSYKIYIPFSFGIGNPFYKKDLTLRQFSINDVHIKCHFDENGDEEKSYLLVNTYVEEDNIHSVEAIADIKVGNSVQSFFDGLSKAFDNAAFFNIYNGDDFVVPYEFQRENHKSFRPNNDRNKGFNLDDEIMSEAIRYANSKDEYLQQSFFYLKEGEYLADNGRFSNAIIQFAIMVEYIINYPLREKGIIENNGELKKKYYYECKSIYMARLDKSGHIPFTFSRYIYGLSKLGLQMEPEIIEVIYEVYRLRNKLAHGYNIYDALSFCNVIFEHEIVSQHNIWNYIMDISVYMGRVYMFFEDNKEHLKRQY